MPQIDCTASLLKDGGVPAKDVGRSAEHPKLSHGFPAHLALIACQEKRRSAGLLTPTTPRLSSWV